MLWLRKELGFYTLFRYKDQLLVTPCSGSLVETEVFLWDLYKHFLSGNSLVLLTRSNYPQKSFTSPPILTPAVSIKSNTIFNHVNTNALRGDLTILEESIIKKKHRLNILKHNNNMGIYRSALTMASLAFTPPSPPPSYNLITKDDGQMDYSRYWDLATWAPPISKVSDHGGKFRLKKWREWKILDTMIKQIYLWRLVRYLDSPQPVMCEGVMSSSLSSSRMHHYPITSCWTH